MFDTLALLMSNIYRKVGSPGPEILTLEDVAAAVWEVFGLYGLDAQQSPEGRITKNVPFTANSRDVALTMAPDIMLPSYVERKFGTEPAEQFVYINVYSQPYLETIRNRGETGCAFFLTELGWQLRLSYNPTGYSHRLHYYTDPVVPGSIDDPLPLAKRFAYMFENAAIPHVAITMSLNSAKLSFEKQMTSLQMEALTALVAHAQAEEEKWRPHWTNEISVNKGPKPRPRRPLVPRGGVMRRTY